MQTSFYIIKSTVVTKEAAEAKWSELYGNRDSLYGNVVDLIDFCLSSPRGEKVYLSLGDKVRLKENAGWRHYAPTSGEAVFGAVSLGADVLRAQFDTEDDFNLVFSDDANGMDLSDYVELI